MIVLQNDSRIEVSKVTNGDSCGGKCDSKTESQSPNGMNSEAESLYRLIGKGLNFVASV